MSVIGQGLDGVSGSHGRVVRGFEGVRRSRCWTAALALDARVSVHQRRDAFGVKDVQPNRPPRFCHPVRVRVLAVSRSRDDRWPPVTAEMQDLSLLPPGLVPQTVSAEPSSLWIKVPNFQHVDHIIIKQGVMNLIFPLNHWETVYI